MTTNRLEPCIKLPLENEILEDIVDKAKDWALMHGAGMRSKVNFSKDSLQFAPFILLPSTFPREEFNKATEIQIILNELIHKVAHDYGFLSSSLKSTVEVDEFTSRLFKIYETVHNEGTAQPVCLGLIRSDIMLESQCTENACCTVTGPYCCWKQVEVNTIASGFGWLGPASASIHRYVLQELGHGDKIKNVPVNTALEGLCGGMLEAWKIYGDPNAVILFVIENITYNICDQRFHEFEIRRQNRMVVVIRRTLTQIADTAKLGKNKELSIDGLSVAVVYFRSGYEPAQYPSSKEWAARLMIERSLAIKCPSIHYHLAGTKKVQQTLATPGVLEKFLTDPAKVDAVKEIFTGLYSLDLRALLEVPVSRMESMMKLTTQNPLSLLFKFGIMGWNGTCADNCSGHGECHNGTCLCEIQFDGPECHVPNLSYYVAFATVFFLLALICLIQLVICIVAEWQRMKAPSLLRACRVTTQKLLYFVVFLAAIVRGAYFTSPAAFEEGWSRSIMSAYYPLLLSGSSLVVCFWAEVFHLRDIRWEKPQFLSKSFLGFVTFNIITYSLLLAEFMTTRFANTTLEEKSFYTHVFNGCYAVLLFIVVIFFLIYGVEVFFKVRGGFLLETTVTTIATSSRTPTHSDPGSESADPAATRLFVSADSNPLPQQIINTSQLHQSRFGLLSQAFMLIIVIAFLFSETLSEFWKKKVPLYSRNWHDIVFRVVEIGVALWFPCVLWNCMSPEQLWILNPKRILRKLDLEPPSKQAGQEGTLDKASQATDEDDACFSKDCWICYDNDRQDVGPLIQPCQCRGDVSSVHHDCLRRWLVESSASADSLHCKVCGSAYQVEQGTRLDWQHGFTARHWLQTTAIVTCMCVSAAGAWVTIQIFEDPMIRMLAAGSALLIQYVCVRFLGLNTVVAYQRAKVSALSIVGGSGHVATISETVAVDIPKTPAQAHI